MTAAPLPAAGMSNVLTSIGGTGGAPWWLINANNQPIPGNGSHPEESLGGYLAVAAQVVIDPTSSTRLFVVGRGGVWRSTDSGASWYPVVNGLAVTVDRRALVNPGNPAQVADGDVDWSTQISSARLTDRTALIEPSTSPYKTSTYSMALDTIPANPVLYVGLGKSTDMAQATGGGVCSTNPWPAPPAPVAVTCMNGPQPGTGTGHLVAGLAIGEPSGTPTLVAVIGNDASGNDGVYTSTSTLGVWSAWVPASATRVLAPTDNNKHVSVWWGQSSPGVSATNLYIYDPDTGLWRSHDKGQTWANLPVGGVSAADPNGYMAGDPTSPNRLYLSLPGIGSTGTVEEIPNATATTLTLTALTPPPGGCWDPTAAGPVAVDPNGVVYLTQGPTASCPASLYQGGTGSLRTTMTEIDDAGYRAQALFPNDIAASADGYLYIPTAGNSVDVQVPINRCPTHC